MPRSRRHDRTGERIRERRRTGPVPDGNGGSIGNVFHVVDHIEKIGDPEVIKKTDGCDHWWNHLAYKGNCTITSKIKYKEVQIHEELRTACSANSFPGTTEVVLADGSRKALRDVRTGDLLMAA
ncbi:hypothetical protein [Streptomyces sp. NPDC058751]|uniref:hypothetical protein n=1 Tax=Streptomyces sp. NPDC058751 TaxID=3346623 RepID=UPI00368338D2